MYVFFLTMYIFFLKIDVGLKINHGGGERPLTYYQYSKNEYLGPNN